MTCCAHGARTMRVGQRCWTRCSTRALRLPSTLGSMPAHMRRSSSSLAGSRAAKLDSQTVRAPPRSAGEIAEQVDITQQAVSQHLQVLKDAGLVAVRQDGTRRLYQTRPEGLESLDQFLAELWPAGLRRLKAAVESDTVETVEAAVEADDR